MLYLTHDERHVYDVLHAEMRAGSEVAAETISHYESDAQLTLRSRMAFSDHRADVRLFVEEAIAALQSGKSLDASRLDSLPSEVLPVVFFALGVRGMTALIAYGLQSARSSDNLREIAALTHIRHLLLQAHASVSARV